MEQMKDGRPAWLQTTLIILRKGLIPLICILAFLIGLIVGYVILGKKDFVDIFYPSTWIHVFELLFKKS